MSSSGYRFLVFLIVLGAVPGCFFGQRFPAGWPRPGKTPENRILDVSGSFSEVGWNVKRQPARFTDFFYAPGHFPQDGQASPIETLEIVQTVEAVTISALAGDRVVWSRQFLKQKRVYRSTERSIRLELEEGADAAEGMGIWSEWYYLYLKKAADGSLLVKHKKMKYTTFFFIPTYFGGYSKWYRFEKKTETFLPPEGN